MQIDPDLSTAHDLRRWYLEEGMNFEMTDLTVLSAHQESRKLDVRIREENETFSAPMKTLAQINAYENHLPASAQGELVRVKAVCAHARHDPVYKVTDATTDLRETLRRLGVFSSRL